MSWVAGTFFTCSACGLWDQPAKQPPPPPPAIVAPPAQPATVGHVAVCVDPWTGLRVEDDQCRHAPLDYTGTDESVQQYFYVHNGQQMHVMWRYYDDREDRRVSPVGSAVTGGTYRTPPVDPQRQTVIVRGGNAVPAKGGTVGKGTVARGGFGVAAGNAHGNSSAS